MIASHELSPASFAEFARGGGDQDGMSVLRAAMLSKHLLLLRVLATDARSSHPQATEQARFEDNLSLLSSIHGSAPSAVATVLAYPHVGAWIVHCVRRIRGKVHADKPLWAELAHLGSVAASCAIRAGIDFSATVPKHQGAVALPSLGILTMSVVQGWQTVSLRGSDGRYEVSDGCEFVTLPVNLVGDSPGWQGIRTVSTTSHASQWSVHLDDQRLGAASPIIDG